MSVNKMRPGFSVPAAKRPGIPADALYQPPTTAWPTIFLCVLAIVLWTSALLAATSNIIASGVAIALQTVAAFMQFTVLHDGVHRSISRKYPLLNSLVTNVAGAFLGLVGVGAAFRYAHFKHHRHTNEAGVDPDLWSGLGSRWAMPLHWATADFYYGYVILKDWSVIPVKERLQIVFGVLLLVAVFSLCAWLGYAREALLYWILPSRFAIVWLAFAFNYLPHHPHDVEQRHNPYASTNVRDGGDAILKWVFLYQNYHLIHHLFPSVPFYRYLRIWRSNRSVFLARGASLVPWYGVNPIRHEK